MLTTTLHERECKHCGRRFIQQRPMQAVCDKLCALRFARAETARKKSEMRARRAALKTIPQLIKEAQHAFNAFVRWRDRDKLCICCDQKLSAGEVGGLYDCGHYRSIGSASHLRFDERNANAQRKRCNRYGAGRAVDYRIGLIARIGLAAVEALESNNVVHKWQRDELIAITKTYRQKLKELRK